METLMNIAQWKKGLNGIVGSIRAHHEELSRLDSDTGDGDHGVTMLRTMTALESTVQGYQGSEIKGLLVDLGWAVMGVDGGSTGPLLGSLFLGMGDPLGNEFEIDCAGLAAMFQAGLEKVQEQTKAQVGDKTMMDALIPAVGALIKASREGKSIPQALEFAARAAEIGARTTKDFQARFGRARNLKERTIGFQDPGATSMAYIFKGFALGIE
jgi:phosphoenolpyruvate---glycerone phosphotransferase subunit DhaL